MGRPPPLDWWKWSSGHWTQMNTWLPKPTKKLLPFTKRMGVRLHKIDGLHGVDEWGSERRHDGYKGRSLFWSFPWIFPSDSATLNCLLDVEFWFSLWFFWGRIWGCNLACLVCISISGFCFPGYMGERRVGYVSRYHPWMHHPLEIHYDSFVDEPQLRPSLH